MEDVAASEVEGLIQGRCVSFGDLVIPGAKHNKIEHRKMAILKNTCKCNPWGYIVRTSNEQLCFCVLIMCCLFNFAKKTKAQDFSKSNTEMS